MLPSSLHRMANRLFTTIGYARPMRAGWTFFRRAIAVLLLACGLLWSPAAQAQDCGQAATQGTAPASWQTYCWLNLAAYNDATARSAAGQNMSFTLPDGAVLTLNARVTGGSGTAYNAVTSPSWSGAAVGNSAFIGIPGRPALYTASAGTRTITLSNIAITPPAGGGVTVFSFVVADAESSNDNEALRIATNGGAWQLLDNVPPISGSSFPAISGVGTGNVTITGRSGTVGAQILGSNSPTTVTVETQAGGLQGVMFAVRFASIRLQTTILGGRIGSSDQFTYQIASSVTGGTIAGSTTSGSGNGPFAAAPLTMSAGLPLTLRLNMAAGSTNALSAYSVLLTCVNTAGPTRSGLPDNLAGASVNIGELQFGESLVCTFSAGAQPRLRLRKLLGTGGRRFNTDQFTVRIIGNAAVVAESTSTGSGRSVRDGDTGLVEVASGRAYTLDEVGAGTTVLGNYAAAMSCSNAASGSTTVLPTAIGGAITPSPGDTITCTITNTRRNTAVLIVAKTSTVISDPVNGTANPKLIPGAIVEYAITVRNAGTDEVDASSIAILDVLPEEVAFAAGTPVTFTNGTTASGLNAFNAATMVRYSTAPGGLAPFDYTPTGTFDANVRAIRIAPTGVMQEAANGSTQPSFTIRFRARVQ